MDSVDESRGSALAVQPPQSGLAAQAAPTEACAAHATPVVAEVVAARAPAVRALVCNGSAHIGEAAAVACVVWRLHLPVERLTVRTFAAVGAAAQTRAAEGRGTAVCGWQRAAAAVCQLTHRVGDEATIRIPVRIQVLSQMCSVLSDGVGV